MHQRKIDKIKKNTKPQNDAGIKACANLFL
jgi:hypothetical protein